MTQPASNKEQIDYWNGDAGKRWAAQQERLDGMLADVSKAVLKAAAPQPGEHVLDVGCGCGQTSLLLADAVGPSGRVVGADISEPMLARAKSRIGSRSQLSFMQADAASHRFDSQFDLLFSRFGVMFFTDPDTAFANLRKSLKPTGRLTFVCWREPRENDWVRVPVAAAREHVPPQPSLGPEDPGPFAFANPGRVRRILANGGFDVITMRPFDTQMILGETLDEALVHLQEFGPISRLLNEASPSQREAAANAIREALAPYAKSSPVKLAGATWLVTAKCG
ncbi:MAG: methyltransferase domain-containing protein [Alphaproteobacteria bacterium]|nr:methyltransferase domain-containing protein [Alphaproteobacteria bacterium]